MPLIQGNFEASCSRKFYQFITSFVRGHNFLMKPLILACIKLDSIALYIDICTLILTSKKTVQTNPFWALINLDF